MKIAICAPTAHRIAGLRAMVDSALGRASNQFDIDFHFYVEEDDVETLTYLKHEATMRDGEQIYWEVGPHIPLTHRWNQCAEIAFSCGADVIAIGADDIIFRTDGWDKLVTDAFELSPDRIRLVFGRDMMWDGRMVGTHFISREWYQAVGYVAHPAFNVWYQDTWNDELSLRIGRRHFIPELVIEGMCPEAGKAENDDTHKRQNEWRFGRTPSGDDYGLGEDSADKYFGLMNTRVDDAAELRTAILAGGGSYPKLGAAIITRVADIDALHKMLGTIAYSVDAISICVTDPDLSESGTIGVQTFDVMPIFSHFPWIDDFSAAKNFAADQLPPDVSWVLNIDSDDLMEGNLALRQLIAEIDNDSSFDAIGLQVRSEYNSGGIIENWQPRIYRRNLRLVNRIHENLTIPGSDRTPNMLGRKLARIIHTGYVCDPDAWEARLERNRHLLDLQLADEPDNYSLLMAYSRQEIATNLPLGLETARRAFEAWDKDAHDSQDPRVGCLMYTTLARALLMNKLHDELLALEAKIPPHYNSAELLYLLASAYCDVGKYDESVAAFRRCYLDETLLRDIGGDPEVWTWKPLESLAAIYSALAKRERGGE